MQADPKPKNVTPSRPEGLPDTIPVWKRGAEARQAAVAAEAERLKPKTKLAEEPPAAHSIVPAP